MGRRKKGAENLSPPFCGFRGKKWKVKYMLKYCKLGLYITRL
jgi:hypothetical protein